MLLYLYEEMEQHDIIGISSGLLLGEHYVTVEDLYAAVVGGGGVAEEALQVANTALDSAELANQKGDVAQNTATVAQNTADAAQTTAQTAQTTATNAANDASTAADNAAIALSTAQLCDYFLPIGENTWTNITTNPSNWKRWLVVFAWSTIGTLDGPDPSGFYYKALPTQTFTAEVPLEWNTFTMTQGPVNKTMMYTPTQWMNYSYPLPQTYPAMQAADATINVSKTKDDVNKQVTITMTPEFSSKQGGTTANGLLVTVELFVVRET